MKRLPLVVPKGFVYLCQGWHSGQTDILYAVASTGRLALGSRRPFGDQVPMSDEEWEERLLIDLQTAVTYARREAERHNHADAPRLRLFETWVRECTHEFYCDVTLEGD